MFFSLNKKIIFTIFTFFMLSAIIFIAFFDNSIGKKIRSEHSGLITRNQYVIELLNENIALRQKIYQMQPEASVQNENLLNQKNEELSRERKLSEELNNNYNENYATLQESLRILSISALLTFLSLIILWFLLHRWIVKPVDMLTTLSIDVANGNFNKRLTLPNSRFIDEFNTLMHTINFMLDNIENNINEIKQTEQFLQNVIDAIPDAIRIIDNNHNIIMSNKAYNEQIKKHYLNSAQKCYAAYTKDASCPCSSTQFICPLKELKRNKNTTLNIIHSINDHPFSISSARISLDGEFGIVESIRDLSDNINYSHQQKISSLGFLASSLAHEMKNNLGAINLILDGILQKYYTNTKEKTEEEKYLIMISEQIKECIKIPERLLKLSHNTEQNSNIFNITTEISDILSLLDYEIKSKGINLITDFETSNEQLKGNETDFKMIILNLLQNAINAMPMGGTLEIKTSTIKDKIEINIKDTGCGISPTAIKHIFEPFYSKSKDKKGTGLGLAIVKDLTLKLNAKISVESEENIGSTFKIEFPKLKS